MHTLYVTNLTFVVLLAHQEYLYSNHYWNKSLITQLVLYITNECVNKDKKVELYVVEKGKMPNSLSKIRRVIFMCIFKLSSHVWNILPITVLLFVGLAMFLSVIPSRDYTPYSTTSSCISVWLCSLDNEMGT